MKIPLPSKFIYYTDDRTASAYVRKNTLYINGLISWEKLAYDLCYALNGRKVCTYCGKTVKKSKMTLDHMFPRFFGGVSIPTNLTPACKSCNNKKSDLNYYEFKVFRTMNEKDGKRYRMSIYRKKRKIRFQRGFDLPRNWTTSMDIKDIIARPIPDDGRNQKKYQRVTHFVERYGHLPNPIVVSANDVLLEGNTIYWVSVDFGFEYVQVIRLDNVFVKLL